MPSPIKRKTYFVWSLPPKHIVDGKIIIAMIIEMNLFFIKKGWFKYNNKGCPKFK